MKKIKLFLVATLMLIGATSMAQSPKIAYLNSREIVLLMPEIESVNANLEAYQKELAETFDAMQSEYAKKANEYQKKSTEWTETMQQQKAREINGIRESIQEFQADAESKIGKRQQELMEPILKKVQDAITAVGKENSYTYIIDSGSGVLVYIDETNAINATQIVKNKLGIKDKK